MWKINVKNAFLLTLRPARYIIYRTYFCFLWKKAIFSDFSGTIAMNRAVCLCNCTKAEVTDRESRKRLSRWTGPRRRQKKIPSHFAKLGSRSLNTWWCLFIGDGTLNRFKSRLRQEEKRITPRLPRRIRFFVVEVTDQKPPAALFARELNCVQLSGQVPSTTKKEFPICLDCLGTSGIL